MAFTASNANLVRQKTYMINRNPGVFYALKALFLNLAANKGNPDLQLVNIDGLLNASDGGAAENIVCAGACHLYAVYGKKTGTTTTYLKFTNNATTAATDGSQELTIPFTDKGEENLIIFPNPHTFGTGITVSADTTVTGSTDTLKANRVDGFAIIGA